MAKFYKLILLFVGLTVMNDTVHAQLVRFSLNIVAVNSTINTINSPMSSGYDWVNYKFKQVTDFNNFPNPAITQTTISYTLSAKTNVTLKVIDLAGKQLAILVKEVQNTGKQEYYWDLAKNKISSGMYILILQADNKIYSRKIIIQ
jgi:hypothetical protein